MAVGYKAVIWNPFKKRYVLGLWLAIAAFLATYVVLAASGQPEGDSFHPVQLVMRAFGFAGFTLLTFILMIGPLARLTDRFKPLLYNRRHMGVSAFFLMLIHAALVMVWYFGFSDLDPFTALLTINPNYDRIGGFPFESLGLVAFLILFLMAATSHDFWLANLGAPFWKALHMGVYIAYALLVAHVLLGVVQQEKSDLFTIWVLASAGLVAGLHLVTGLREFGADRRATKKLEGWLEVGPAMEIGEDRGRIVQASGGERIAVFRYALDGVQVVSAISNACKHQNGPLGEGRIVNGCVVCPWHGYEYHPRNGRAPAPFTEKIATYRVEIRDGVVFVDPKALPAGTDVEPARLEGQA
jgi:DMSO/TMAO reductase YedYZ heme-binding membrane subunit